MREGSLACRLLPDGRELAVYRLIPGTARLVISESPAAETYLDGW